MYFSATVVFGHSAAHTSLHGKFMAKHQLFTVRAETEAKSEAGLPFQKTRLPAVLATLCNIRPQGSDDEALVCKACRAVSPVIQKVSTSTASSTIVSLVTSYSGMATSYDLPVSRPLSILYGGQPPILPVSMPLLRFATKEFVPSPVRSALVATRPYPSSPESYASTTCVDLDASDCSGSSDGHISVSPVGSECVSVSSVNFR